MSRIARSAALTAAVVALVAVAISARAEPMAPAVIAIIDYQGIERGSRAALDIISQANEYRAQYQAELSSQQEALRAEAEELERQRTILSPTVFSEKRHAFEAKAQALEQQVMDRNRQFDRALGSARNEILRTVLVIVSEIAEDRRFNIVLDSSQALFVAKSLNITEVVMEELNLRLPSVAVSLPPQE